MTDQGDASTAGTSATKKQSEEKPAEDTNASLEDVYFAMYNSVTGIKKQKLSNFEYDPKTLVADVSGGRLSLPDRFGNFKSK